MEDLNDNKDLEVKNLLEQSDDFQESERKNDDVSYSTKVKGILAILVQVILIVLSATCCQLLRRRLPDFELNTMRSFAGLIFMIFGLMYQKKLPWIQKSHIFVTFCYGCTNVIISTSIYVAVTFVSVASVQSLIMTSNITSGIFIFWISGVEKITWYKGSFAALCICGVILVVQPEFIFMHTHTTGNENDVNETYLTGDFMSNLSKTFSEAIYRENEAENYVFIALGYLLPLLAGILISINILLVKKFPFLGQELLATCFWGIALGIVISAIAMAIFENPVLPESWLDFGYILGHCCTFGLIWFFCLIGSSYVSGNTVNIIYSTSPVFMLISQYTVLSSIHPGNGNWIEVVGTILVLLGSSLGSFLEFFKT